MGEMWRKNPSEFTSDDFTWQVAGELVPALDYIVPCDFSEQGSPIGLPFVGRAFDEATVLRAALVYEQATDWHLRCPAVI